MKITVTSLALLVGFVWGFARAEPGDVLGSQFLYRYSPDDVNRITARLYPNSTVLPAQETVDGYRVQLESRDEQGERLEIIVQLYVPVRDSSAELPIYGVATGTTGLSDACAPSRERPAAANWGDYQAQALAYAGQGFIVVLPDPAGFNDEASINRYFVARASAQVILDAARAVPRVLGQLDTPVRAEEAVFFGGYSQGGHTVFAAADLQADYAPDVPLRGVIGYGPTTNVAAMLQANPYFGPYLVYAYSRVYGREQVAPRRVLRAGVVESLEQDTLGRCVDSIFGFYGSDAQRIYTPAFWRSLNAGELNGAFAQFETLLSDNNSGLAGSGVPALILQGTADTVVTPQQQEAFATQTCLAGTPITYVTYANVDHFQTRQFGYRDTLTWMDTVLAGEAPRDDCARFTD